MDNATLAFLRGIAAMIKWPYATLGGLGTDVYGPIIVSVGIIAAGFWVLRMW